MLPLRQVHLARRRRVDGRPAARAAGLVLCLRRGHGHARRAPEMRRGHRWPAGTAPRAALRASNAEPPMQPASVATARPAMLTVAVAAAVAAAAATVIAASSPPGPIRL
eukprot:6180573-Pleurochrysis_carterae.AAC.3